MSVTADPRRIEFARPELAAIARDVSLDQRVSTLERRIFTGTAPLDPLPGSIPGTAIAPGTTPGDIFDPAAQLPGTIFGPGTVPGNVVIPGTLRTNHFYADDAWITLIGAHSISSDYLYVGVEDAKLINTEHLRAGSVDADRMTFDVAMGNKVLANLQVAQDIETDGLSAVSGSFGTMTAGKALFTGASGAKLGLGSTLQYTPPGGSVTTFDGILAADSTGAVTLKFDIATGNLEIRGDIKSGSTGLGNIAGQIHGAAQIQPNTIPGDNLVTDSIGVRVLNGVEINALDLDVTSANVGNLKVGAVDFMTITGPTMQTSSSNPRVVLDPGGLRAFDASGNTTVEISAGDGSFTARNGNITGAQIQTSDVAYPRIVMNASGLWSTDAANSVNPFWLHADTGLLELRNLHFVDIAGAQENIEWYTGGSRFGYISATSSAVNGNTFNQWIQGSYSSGRDPIANFGSIYNDSGGTNQYIYLQTNQNQVTANARGQVARLIDYAGQSSFLQLAGGVARQKMACGTGFASASSTTTIPHGLTDAAGNGVTPVSIVVTTYFNSGIPNIGWVVQSPGSSQFTVGNPSATSSSFFWMAVG
jgi:hypothetical protein